MAAITAYKADLYDESLLPGKTQAELEALQNQARQIGLAALGTAVEAPLPADWSADEFRSRLVSFLTDPGRYYLAYEFKQNADFRFFIGSVGNVSGNKKIPCVLYNMPNTIAAGNKVGDLDIVVEVDKKSGDVPNKKFEMNVAFPHIDDVNGLAYFSTPVKDIAALSPVVGNASPQAMAYLAAFKLLSRCK